MSADNRAMTVAQAKVLAADLNVAPAVMVRLANGYPEVWSILLENPSIYPELRQWLEAAMAPPSPIVSTNVGFETTDASPAAHTETTLKPARRGVRLRRRRSHSTTLAGVIIPPALLVVAMFIMVAMVFAGHPEPGKIATQNIRQAPSVDAAWSYSLETTGSAKCAQYSFKDFDQDLVVVLVQNNLSREECRDQDKPAASTLALVNSRTGAQLWQVDLADEVTWTRTWRKEIVSTPGLNEIILKLTDINGNDAGGDKKSVDDGDDRKMKTLIPFNKLNGRITDPVIAKSTAQPTMQAPVVEVLTLPGNTQDLVVMSNGSEKDFRYAYHRAKDLSSSDWSYESDLKPVGGNPLVGDQLILGRGDDDEPVAISLVDGLAHSWAGPAGGKLYVVDGAHIHVRGDGVTDKVSNVTSQGGKDGHDVTISGIDVDGGQKWSVDARGFALSNFVPISRMSDRNSFSEIYSVSGDANRTLSRINTANGDLLWSTRLTGDRFELSKLANGSTGAAYITAKDATQAKSFVTVNLASGELGASVAIAGAEQRIDGATADTLFVVDEPERKRIVSDFESGKQSNSDDDGKDKSDERRVCIFAVDVTHSEKLWELECNGNQHIALLGGNWMVIDKTPGHETMWPLAGVGK